METIRSGARTSQLWTKYTREEMEMIPSMVHMNSRVERRNLLVEVARTTLAPNFTSTILQVKTLTA